MAVCSRVETCPLFKQFQMKAALRVWQGYYCEGDFNRCERWKLVSAGKPVPMNLLPNGHTLDVPLDRLESKHMS
ncbi:MAG TPA: hypothetical protein VLT61_10440 [Anaeromyxobacteraceae bacterium]|nr:hypothetical protein [Anaeromyxobacteraceae bacterium]